MNSDGWGTSWPINPVGAEKRTQHGNTITGWDLGNGADKTVVTKITKDHVELTEYYKVERTNKVPTHDPYTNPNAQIYFSCNCGAILDPGTKSFASLCKSAGDAGWKIRFGETHYNAYCVECGKDVE